jgi:hypothetical protein
MESEIQAKNRMRQAKLAMKKKELQEAGHSPELLWEPDISQKPVLAHEPQNSLRPFQYNLVL